MYKRVVSNLPRLALILLLTLVSVGLPVRVAAGEALPVVASFSILGDLTQQIGGDRVRCTPWLARGRTRTSTNRPPPTPKRLSRARLVVVNGLGFEGWIDRLIKSSGYRGKRVVASQGINAIRKHRPIPASTRRTTTPAMPRPACLAGSGQRPPLRGQHRRSTR
jgi:ABC-type Zn uptake system ZnuABC Zn-binding protein ZnuA